MFCFKACQSLRPWKGVLFPPKALSSSQAPSTARAAGETALNKNCILSRCDVTSETSLSGPWAPEAPCSGRLTPTISSPWGLGGAGNQVGVWDGMPGFFTLGSLTRR